MPRQPRLDAPSTLHHVTKSGMLVQKQLINRIGLCKSKDGRQQKAFDALEWLAAMSSHIPDTGEQMVRYYGYYSNVCRGRRQKEDQCIFRTIPATDYA